MARVLFGIWLLVIVGLSFAPWSFKVHLTRGPFHNAGHWLAFFVATLLWCWKISSFRGKLLRCGGILFVAMGLEGGEMIISSHHLYEWSDVRVDSLGILAGLMFILLLENRFAFAKTPRDFEASAERAGLPLEQTTTHILPAQADIEV